MPSPSDRVYSQTHEWHKADGDVVTIGLTKFAVDALTDVTYVEMKKPGAKVKADTTLRELRFTDEALMNAKAKATPEAMPFLANLSLDTTIGELPFFKGHGCDSCGSTGLKGRQGLYEVMFMTPTIKKAVMINSDVQVLRETAIAEGMLTLRMDGWLKVLKGVTTLDQVIRETST